MTFYDARGELAEKAKQKKKQAGFSVRVEDEKFLQPIPVPRDAKIKKTVASTTSIRFRC